MQAEMGRLGVGLCHKCDQGMEYKGSLKSIDQYMNLQLLNTEAHELIHL